MAASPARQRRSPRRRDPQAYRPYPSDLTDEQWALIEPMVPEPQTQTQGPGSGGGGQVIHERRRIIEAILYINRAGCAWRMLPHDFPAWQTVYWYFTTWTADATLDRIHDALRDGVRDAAGRDPMASAGAVDSQSVKSAETVGSGTGSRGTTAGDVRGWDGGKKINGRKRHLVVDTMGLLIAVMVTGASVQDRDGGSWC